jgi:hypothetical protein
MGPFFSRMTPSEKGASHQIWIISLEGSAGNEPFKLPKFGGWHLFDD